MHWNVLNWWANKKYFSRVSPDIFKVRWIENTRTKVEVRVANERRKKKSRNHAVIVSYLLFIQAFSA